MAAILYDYMGYENLSSDELDVVIKYFDHTKNTRDVDRLLQSDAPLSKDMRRFIADVFTERVTLKKMGRPSTTRRDKWIHMQVENLVFSGMNLTSTKDGKSAIVKIAESMELSEDIVLKAYQKIENGDSRLEKGEGYNDPLHRVRIKGYDDNGVIKYDFIGDIL